MCGIAGFYNARLSEHQISELIGGLKHRGPDAQQFYEKNDVGLVHTRLSIIELSALGAQPYRFENLVLVFNGELYNYKEVREELIKVGYSFLSNSDTETLIKAFHHWGPSCIDRFIGMFAFAVYDETLDEMYLFRDRVGVKPLYFSYTGGQLFFASELKVFTTFRLDQEINTDAVSLYFRFGFIPAHHSIYRSVHKLEAGHYLKISRTDFVKKKYWTVSPKIDDQKTEKIWLEELESLLISAFRYRMVSDVPVGVFLSGGIDSTLLTSILQKYEGGIHTFTIGFSEKKFDESIYAQKVARHLGTVHTQKTLNLNEARSLLRSFYDIYDEPFADTSGIPTACVTQLAKQNGLKVVLSADGGDELFGGYTHYRNTLRLWKKFQKFPMSIRSAMAKGSRTFLPSSLRKNVSLLNLEHKVYAFEELAEAEDPASFFEAIVANQTPAEINRLMVGKNSSSVQAPPGGSSPLQAMMNWDFQYFLPDDLLVKVDRATMFFGVECREPFLDHRVVEFAATIPDSLKIKDGKGKFLLRKLLKNYVPEELYERKKQGFSIPVFAWFNQELDGMFSHYLSADSLKRVPFLNAEEIGREHRKYLQYKKNGKEYNIEKMWRILSFMLWWEKYKQ